MKDRLKNNLGLKIVALLFATLLWLFVVNEENPIMTKKYIVPIEIAHGEVITNKGKSYQVLEDTKNVTVTVKATRDEMEKIKPEDIRAIANLIERQLDAELEKGEIFSVPVRVTINGHKYEEAYAAPRNIQIRTEDNEKKTFPITPKASGAMAQGYSIGELVAEPQSIDVSGPKSSVGRISKVVAKVDVSNLSGDATLPAELIFYDSADNVIDQTLLSHKLKETETGAFVKVHVLETKSVKLKFDTSEIVTEKGYTFSGITFEPQTVDVIGKKSDLEALTYIEIGSDALRLDKISKKTEVVVDVTKYLPEGITLAKDAVGKIAVSVQVEKNGVKSIQMPVGSTKVNNLSDDMELAYGAEQEIELQFEGKKELLDGLTLETMVVSIDLKDYKEEGTYDVPVKVTGLPEGVNMVEGTTITVVLKKK